MPTRHEGARASAKSRIAYGRVRSSAVEEKRRVSDEAKSQECADVKGAVDVDEQRPGCRSESDDQFSRRAFAFVQVSSDEEETRVGGLGWDHVEEGGAEFALPDAAVIEREGEVADFTVADEDAPIRRGVGARSNDSWPV